jgi:hypothetical protein
MRRPGMKSLRIDHNHRTRCAAVHCQDALKDSLSNLDFPTAKLAVQESTATFRRLFDGSLRAAVGGL